MKRLFLILIIGLMVFGNDYAESAPVAGTYSNNALGAQDYDGTGEVIYVDDNNITNLTSAGDYWSVTGAMEISRNEGDIIDNGDGTASKIISTVKSGTFIINGDKLWGQPEGTSYTATYETTISGTTYYLLNGDNWSFDYFTGSATAFGEFTNEPFTYSQSEVYYLDNFHDGNKVDVQITNVVTTIEAIGVSNNSPTAPTLSSPSNGSVDVSLTTTITTNAFSDPDEGDTHLKTDWQISASKNFLSSFLTTGNIVYKESAIHLTSLPVPDLALQENTTYYWRARFYDNNSNVSEWSEVFSFTTLQTQNDVNENGIPDRFENKTIDLDNDGTTDIQQETIKSLNTVVGNGQMGASIKSSTTVTTITEIDSIDPDTISEVARPTDMPLGLLSLRLTVPNAGDTTDVTIYFSEAAPPNANWYFYDSINGWMDYSDHATFSQDRKSVFLELKDGGYGDADGIANGIIVDPSGFGIASWIKGFVSDSLTSKKITTATISFEDLNLNLNTLLDGHYVSMLLPGTYDLSVSAPGYGSQAFSNLEITEASIVTKNIALTSTQTNDCIINAKINTQEKGYIDGVWTKGGEDTTSRGDRVVWGYFYADPNDVTWGSINNPEVFVKIWYDAGGRVDVNFFHVSVPDIEVSATYNGVDLQAVATTIKRYIRHCYNDNNSLDGTSENTEDGIPVAGYNPSNNPYSYSTINNLNIGAMINTVEAVGSIDALWALGGQDTTTRGDQVVWGHFYADPNDVSWGSKNNPELFVKIWFDASGRIDVNYFHVSVPDIEVYSDYGSDGVYDTKGTTIMDDRYIRQEYSKQ